MSKNEISSRSKILELEKNLLNNVDDKNIVGNKGEIVRSNYFPLKHTFADGVYIRQMTMKQDSVVVGAIHNHLHVWFLLKGHVTIANKEGVEDYEAPCQVISTPGTRRIIQANKDSIFVNVHKNPDNFDINRLKELEKQFCSMNMEEYKNRKI